MSGKRRPKKDPSENIENVISAAAAQEGASAETLSTEDLKTLADEVELLKADFGRWDSYKGAATEYVDEFTKEIKWHRRVRLGVSIGGGALILFLSILLVCGISKSTEIFGTNAGNALTALIVGCIGGCVIVTIALIKGAFSNVADRNAGLPMPDHIKEIVDAGKNITGIGR